LRATAKLVIAHHDAFARRNLMGRALGALEAQIASRTWAMGDDFTMADCAAVPALFYADKVSPLAETYPNVAAYLGRLTQRPSYARALNEAEPYFQFFPRE
jgi:glutathione S-transferase